MDAFKSVVGFDSSEKFLLRVFVRCLLVVDEVLDVAELVLSLFLDSLTDLSERDVSMEVSRLSAFDVSLMFLSCFWNTVEEGCSKP